ncbi:unnamed protein product [Amoebophrya sp. A25]|nr:unnamed protein product [Amoebophrya sp. A25]|eukprot:GSA25T00004540001.1
MEKYRQFADATKGVNPFVPVWSNRRLTLLQRLMKLLVCGGFLVPVRAALFVVGFALLFLASIILSLLSCVPAVHDIFATLLLPIPCRICLLASGFFWVNYGEETDARRLKLATPDKKNGSKTTLGATHGWLLFTNFQGPVDVLYYGMLGYNSFVFTNPKTLRFEATRTLITSFFRAIEVGDVLVGAAGDDEKKQGARNSSGNASSTGSAVVEELPVDGLDGRRTVVFAEGGKTNGTCVLPFTGIASFLSRGSGLSGRKSKRLGAAQLDFYRVTCSTLVYDNSNAKASAAGSNTSSATAVLFTPAATTTTSLLGYLLSLQYQYAHTVERYHVSPELVGFNLTGEALTTSISTQSQDQEQEEEDDATTSSTGSRSLIIAEKLRSWVATMPSPVLHEVNNSASDLALFHKYWTDTQKKKYT